MVVPPWSLESDGGAAGDPGQPSGLTEVVGPMWGCGQGCAIMIDRDQSSND